MHKYYIGWYSRNMNVSITFKAQKNLIFNS